MCHNKFFNKKIKEKRIKAVNSDDNFSALLLHF